MSSLHPQARVHPTPDGQHADWDGYSREIGSRRPGPYVSSRQPPEQGSRGGAKWAVRHPGEWTTHRWHAFRPQREAMKTRLAKVAHWLRHGHTHRADFTPQREADQPGTGKLPGWSDAAKEAIAGRSAQLTGADRRGDPFYARQKEAAARREADRAGDRRDPEPRDDPGIEAG